MSVFMPGIKPPESRVRAVTIRVNLSEDRSMRHWAATFGVSVSELIRNALLDYLPPEGEGGQRD